MRSGFDRQLDSLHEKLIEMGALCEDGILASLEALQENPRAVLRTREIEKSIDQAERDIEGLCMKLLLQQQPVARDLRQISSALKMISDMERIGDQAADIAELAPFLTGNALKSAPHLDTMAKAAAKMVTDSVESFVKADLEMARQVQRADDEVDGLFDDVKKELLERISRSPAEGEVCLDLLMIAKYLERIADHAVNVSEWVEYSITGTHTKE